MLFFPLLGVVFVVRKLRLMVDEGETGQMETMMKKLCSSLTFFGRDNAVFYGIRFGSVSSHFVSFGIFFFFTFLYKRLSASYNMSLLTVYLSLCCLSWP